MKVYVAAGWFTDEQEEARQIILKSLHVVNNLHNNYFTVYSPKEDFLFEKGKTKPQEVFEANVKKIMSIDFIIASTVGKDMGTLFECGVAYAQGRSIVYYWPYNVDTHKKKFNLMLSQSSRAVCRFQTELLSILLRTVEIGFVPFQHFDGDIE